MLETTLIPEAKIVVLRPSPPLHSAEFEEAAKALDPELQRLGKLDGVMIIAANFRGAEDFSALATELHFLRDHHRQVARVAVVSDADEAQAMPELAGHFINAEVRVFDSEDDARAWISEAGTR